MTRFLLATDSVHTTAAACDYLGGRLRAEDAVTVLTVREAGTDPRDGGDALNVARARIGGLAAVDVATREGEPAAEILDVLGSEQIDEVVVGARGGGPGAGCDLGETARTVLVAADVPVVVVPQERLDRPTDSTVYG